MTTKTAIIDLRLQYDSKLQENETPTDVLKAINILNKEGDIYLAELGEIQYKYNILSRDNAIGTITKDFYTGLKSKLESVCKALSKGDVTYTVEFPEPNFNISVDNNITTTYQTIRLNITHESYTDLHDEFSFIRGVDITLSEISNSNFSYSNIQSDYTIKFSDVAIEELQRLGYSKLAKTLKTHYPNGFKPVLQGIIWVLPTIDMVMEY